MKILKRIDIGSAAIMGGATSAALGFVLGVFFLLFGGLFSSFGGRESAGFGLGFGVAGIVLFPIFYGVAGLIGAAIYAAIYNIIAGFVGGVKVELE
jgi:hypothetical protein